MSASHLARSLVTALLEAGVGALVVTPGSRNAPLAFAAHDAAAAGRATLHTRLDERGAGFLALGLTVVGARAAVMCTSGTAVANLHPAALEAAHSGLPLVLVTADRPARFRGTSANQTTDQVGIFPGLTCLDVTLATPQADLAGALAGPGPVHLNVAFDEPLVPADRWTPPAATGAPSPHPVDPGRVGEPAEPAVISLAAGSRTVVVAGDGAGPGARRLAERAAWPLLAEPTSGARTGSNALRCYRLLLDGPLGRQIERVVVTGHPTLSRPVTRLLARPEVEICAVPGPWRPPPFHVDRVLDPALVVLDGPADSGWLASWRAADRTLSEAVDRAVLDDAELTPYAVARMVSDALPPGGLLYVGASSPIRDLDLMAPPHRVGMRRRVVANRGLSGIDGVVSSAIGAALGRTRSTRCVALMGDVTFLHDSTGLITGTDSPRPDLTIVVVNDDGGSIFAVLEQGAPEYADRYDALFGMPHGVDIGALCAASGIPHRRVASPPELRVALHHPRDGIEVIEAPVRRDNRRALDDLLRRLAPG